MAEFTDHETSIIFSAKASIRSKISYLKKLIPATHYDDMFLTGGAIASLIQGGTPKDWDVYFQNVLSQDVVKKIFIDIHPDEIAVIDEKYRQVTSSDNLCITENAITLKNDIQFITKHTGTPEQIRETFDFVHCKPYYHFGHDQLFISREQYDLCFNKKLKINNMKSLTTWRQSKFEQRGYTWP